MVLQKKNKEGPNFCVTCRCLFAPPEMSKAPSWVFGVLAVLVGVLNLQMMKM